MAARPGSTPVPAKVVVTGAAGALGRRVVSRVIADPGVGQVVAIDQRPLPGGPGVLAVTADLATVDLEALMDGASEVLHLAQPPGPVYSAAARLDAELARRVLDAAGSSGVEHVVLLSSATAYGAWPDNPLPLTEDAPLRPNPGNGLAEAKVALERVATEWREAHPGTTVSILRPTVVVTADGNGWLGRALRRAPSVPPAGEEPPGQFLHLDDLAFAVDLARRARLDGPCNVAPDGWVDGRTVRALAGVPAVRVPGLARRAVVALGWRGGLGDTPPELLPLLTHPWVIANDRLRAAGWVPTHTSEEAYVDAHSGGPLCAFTRRRRLGQALGAGATALLVVATVVLSRRARGSRSRWARR
jgi:nucleoside-diphosphate-sugar epimerase